MHLPPTAYGNKPVRWVIDISGDGALRGFVSRGGDKNNRRGALLTVPISNVNRTVNIKPNLLSDNGEYVLGIGKPNAKPVKVKLRHESFIELARRCAEETDEPSVRAVVRFLDTWSPENMAGLLPVDFDANLDLTFRVNGDFPVGLPSVQKFWAKNTADPDSRVMQCLVTGDNRLVQGSLPENVKGLSRIGGQTSGTALVAANARAFESYGLEGSFTSPISRDAGERFGKALNELLAGEKSQVRVGNVVYVFWTREPTEMDIGMFMDRPDPDRVKDLIRSAETGRYDSVGVGANRFYALALSASGGRAVVRDWLEKTIPEVERNLRDWFLAQEIVDYSGQEAGPLGVFRLAASAYRDANKEMQPAVSAAMVRVALNRGRLPDDLLARAVRRCVVGTARQDGTREHVTRERAALIKLILTTQERLSMSDMKSLNEEPSFEGNELAAYNCGRLLAQLEAVQIKAQGRKVNTTVIDRYYGAVSTTPSKVVGLLMSNAQDHLSKIRKKDRGAYEGLQRKIEEIMQPLKKGYPNTLSMSEQGLFALGYYHQRAQNRVDIKAASDKTNESPDGEES
jgi:CRISPR-associated protein Csd1